MTRSTFRTRSLTVGARSDTARRLYPPGAFAVVSIEGDEYVYDEYLTRGDVENLVLMLQGLLENRPNPERPGLEAED